MDTQQTHIPKEAEAALPPADSRMGKFYRALLKRYPIWPVIQFFMGKKVPEHKHSAWYMLGGIALFLFLIQLVTGVLLMVYYKPGQPWASVNRIVMEVPFGALIRSIHHWSANLMILTLFLHMFSTLFMKAYRPPREGTWITGFILLTLVTLFGFSGYLLPWDDLAFFAVRIGVSEMEKLPVLGTFAADLARGGPDVSMETIGRFYALHVVILPLLVLALIALHLLFVQIQGVSEPDTFAALPLEKKKYRKFFSDFMIGEIPVWLFMFGLLIALSAAAPRGLAPEANPMGAAPEGIKPEWYLLAPYQALKLFPGKLELVGMAIMGLGPLLVIALPFIDKNVPTDKRGEMITQMAIAGLIGFLGMTIWGLLS
ncbi:MAG: cytochrome b N-terminal domain-containing protein [Deltaproteobacteria bacterium]|nr:cytochrome b N-terminal domain-containing protein [Deltaproteobacteria bacterium]MBN2671551.1 cytochrome b N-terminal domain-containing protein [Deltaproteobacteria bacterium]